MNFRRRLERLSDGGGPPPVRVEGGEPAAHLHELRAELQALTERLAPREGEPLRSPAVTRPAGRASQALEGLPFEPIATPRGTVWLRRERFSPAHAVGRVRLDSLWRAEPAVIARLALDERLANAAPLGWLFLDLETTGLGGAGALAFVVGMARLEAEGYVLVEQLLLREPASEAALLDYVRGRYEAANLVVTYNGKSFDRPLLEGRLIINRLPRLPERPELDLLHVGRRLHQRRLQRCTLKRIESEVLGFRRGHDIDGSEVAARYSHFLRTGDARELRAVVDHNLFDVVSMLALGALYGQALPELVGEDLAGLARTLERAGARGDAERVADEACQRGGGAEALRVRAQLRKARGDALGAVSDFERLCRERSDPAGHLELAKLYEHKVRRPALALEWMSRGTGESRENELRRRRRLERKLGRELTRARSY